MRTFDLNTKIGRIIDRLVEHAIELLDRMPVDGQDLWRRLDWMAMRAEISGAARTSLAFHTLAMAVLQQASRQSSSMQPWEKPGGRPF